MSSSCKAVFNRRFEERAVSAWPAKRDQVNKPASLLANTLLATSLSVGTGTATADIAIDGGAVRNVVSGELLDAAGDLYVGLGSTGRLNIASGGEVSNTNAYIGANYGSQGEVFVSGTGARWTTSGFLTIGWNGNAFVSVDNGASITAGGGVDLSTLGNGFAQLTVAGTDSARGVLSTSVIMKGTGIGLLEWDGGILQARSDETDFFLNFAFGEINISNNGAFFDTNGYNVGVVQTPGILTGVGGLTKLGAGTLTIGGSNSWSGDTTVSAGTLELGSYTQNGSQTLTIGVTDAANYGKLNVSGVANFNNSNLAVDVIGSPALATNLSLAGVVTAGTLNATGFNVTDNSALFDFTATVNSNSVDLNVIASSNASTGTTAYRSALNNRLYPALGAASVLDTQIQGTPTGDMADVVTALGRLPDERTVARATAQTLPLNAAGEATLGALTTINSIFASRFAPGATGMSAGDLATNKKVWIKPFAARADQDDTSDNASGYSADTWGLAAGVEGEIGDTQLGLAYAYANTRLDGNTRLSGAGTHAEIDSHVLALYGSRPLSDMVLGFQIDAGWNDNDSKRALDFGGLNRTASASYDSWSLHAGGNLSKAITLGQANTFIPAIRADYTRLRSQSYTERGAGALSLDVDASTVEALTFGVDGRFIHALSPNAQLEASVGVSYDLINDDGNLVAAYMGTPGQRFAALGIDHGPWLAKAGVGYTYSLENGTDILIRYEANGRNDYLSQSASVRAVWNF